MSDYLTRTQAELSAGKKARKRWFRAIEENGRKTGFDLQRSLGSEELPRLLIDDQELLKALSIRNRKDVRASVFLPDNKLRKFGSDGKLLGEPIPSVYHQLMDLVEQKRFIRTLIDDNLHGFALRVGFNHEDCFFPYGSVGTLWDRPSFTCNKKQTKCLKEDCHEELKEFLDTIHNESDSLMLVFGEPREWEITKCLAKHFQGSFIIVCEEFTRLDDHPQTVAVVRKNAVAFLEDLNAFDLKEMGKEVVALRTEPVYNEVFFANPLETEENLGKDYHFTGKLKSMLESDSIPAQPVFDEEGSQLNTETNTQLLLLPEVGGYFALTGSLDDDTAKFRILEFNNVTKMLKLGGSNKSEVKVKYDVQCYLSAKFFYYSKLGSYDYCPILTCGKPKIIEEKKEKSKLWNKMRMKFKREEEERAKQPIEEDEDFIRRKIQEGKDEAKSWTKRMKRAKERGAFSIIPPPTSIHTADTDSGEEEDFNYTPGSAKNIIEIYDDQTPKGHTKKKKKKKKSKD